MSSNSNLLAVAFFVAVTVSSITCQEFNSSSVEPSNVTLTDHPKNESESNASPPANTPSAIAHESEAQPQADQPPQDDIPPAVHPTRPPALSTQSTFPPVVHHITTEAAAAAKPIETTSQKAHSEAAKPTPVGEATTKKPETTPASKEGKQGSSGIVRESLALTALSMCIVFGYLH